MDNNNSTNIEKLKSKWEQFKFDPSVSNAEKKAFDNWQPGNNIKEMTLEQYTNLLKEEEGYFTNWMERKTKRCGRFSAAGSTSFGIFREDKPDKTYKASEQISKPDNQTSLNVEKARQVFEEKVKPDVVKLTKFEDLNTVSPLGINYARKIAYMYNPDKLLPIFKNEVIDEIAKILDIKEEVDSSNYKATAVILNKLTEEWKLENSGFEFTQKLGAFMWEMFGNVFSLESKNIIFHGAPGTGKTYTVEKGIKQRILIAGDEENEVFELAQFHPSYSYEDFIEGFKPVKGENGSISLELKAGRFKLFCKRAMENLKEERKKKSQKDQKPKNYYFVADEINRAELSRVLGEVLVCLEESKRIDNFDENGKPTSGLYLKSQYGHLDTEDQAVLTIDGEHYFGIPSNLYFIGTMNDIDRSIDSFDLALRRRFVWKMMDCDYGVIKKELSGTNNDLTVEQYVDACKALNKLITEAWGLGLGYQIGHAYFLDVCGIRRNSDSGHIERVGKISDSAVNRLFDSKIKLLLQEYLRAEYSSDEIEKKLIEAKNNFTFKDNSNAQ